MTIKQEIEQALNLGHYDVAEIRSIIYAKIGQDLGWDMFSPHERDEDDDDAIRRHAEARASGDFSEALPFAYYMKFDLYQVCERDAVFCLPGWEKSTGARLETMAAVSVDHPVFEVVNGDGSALAAEEIEKGDTSKWKLASVDPEYVGAVFAIESIKLDPLKLILGGDPEHELSEDCWCGPTVVTVQPGEGVFKQDIEAVADMLGWTPTEEQEAMIAEGLANGTIIEYALPVDSAGRKSVPLTTGVLDYFPAALAEVAKVSKAGNDKHNPGEPLHHARAKSTDHADSLLRHLVDRGKIDADTGQRHSAEIAWRSLAMLQQELEDEGLAPLPRGARLGGGES